MYIQMPPVSFDTTPKVAAVFQAANVTVGRVMEYDMSVMDNSPNRKPLGHRSSAHTIKKGNLYTGAVNPSAKTNPFANSR